jgi:DNA-binding CsgD family transcriptional regulator
LFEDGLLERDDELARIHQLLGGARAGGGGLLVIVGPAGIGKTALLRAATAQAKPAGMRVAAARARELESGFSFGVVRQLFEPVLSAAGQSERDVLLAGAARRAAIALDAIQNDGAPLADNDPSFAVIHGLYWLAVNASSTVPLIISIDDLQWADPPSLEFLLYLADRLAGLPIGLLASWRLGEAGSNADRIARLEHIANGGVVRPAPLSRAAVQDLMSGQFGQRPHERFTEACHEAAGGNPFLLRELAAGLQADGIRPDEAAAIRVSGLGPRSIARAVTFRVARLGPTANQLARATSILGDGTQLRFAAALARVGLGEAAEAADRLAEIGVLEPGMSLRFVHPIVRAAIHDDIPESERGVLHAEAARRLAAEGADLEEVCAHLLVCEPAGSADVARLLQMAARRALTRGVPHSAASYLRRAVAERADVGTRAAVLLELGRVERIVGDPAAARDLGEALDLTRDLAQRPAVALDLVHTLFVAGQWEAGSAAAQAALDELAAVDHYSSDLADDDATRLQCWWAWGAAYEPGRVAEFDARLSDLLAMAKAPAPGARLLAALLVNILSSRGERREEVVALLDHALDDGRLLARVDSDSWFVAAALFGAVWLGEVTRAEALAEQMLTRSRSRGSVVGVVTALGARVAARTHRGALVDAETDIRSFVEMAHEHFMWFAIPQVLYWGADALIERPELADVAALANLIELPPTFARTLSGGLMREIRGRLALAGSDLRTARTELQAAADTYLALDMNVSSWRSALAQAVAGEDPAEALRLARSELSNAQRLGSARLTGIALRTLGVLEGGQLGLDRLHEAVTVLERSDAPLELARALVELGAALRRANQRLVARESLRLGLELAYQCGASRLAQRASIELQATGARPRRAVLTGLEALTPSERRIAELAAGGLSNAEIAQALFVTINTVEGHLRHAYRKLSINSRGLLSAALKAAAPGTAGTVAQSLGPRPGGGYLEPQHGDRSARPARSDHSSACSSASRQRQNSGSKTAALIDCPRIESSELRETRGRRP